jgi:chromosome segregation ATPase
VKSTITGVNDPGYSSIGNALKISLGTEAGKPSDQIHQGSGHEKAQ